MNGDSKSAGKSYKVCVAGMMTYCVADRQSSDMIIITK